MIKYNIELEEGEKTYNANVTEEKNIVTVSCMELGSKSGTFKGNSELIANTLLKELLNQSRGHGWK